MADDVRTEDAAVVHTFPSASKIAQAEEFGIVNASWTSDSRIALSRGMGPQGKTNLIELINPDTLQPEWSHEFQIDSPWRNFALAPHGRPGEAMIFKSIDRFFFFNGSSIDGPYQPPGFTISRLVPVDSRSVICATTEKDALGGDTAHLRRFDRARGAYSDVWSPPVHQTGIFAASPSGNALFLAGHGSGKSSSSIAAACASPPSRSNAFSTRSFPRMERS